MKTIIRNIEKECIEKSVIREAAEIIKKGGTVVFPTETVYGLGADALNEKAAKSIYKAKGRPSDNPLIIHISEYEDLKKITKEIPKNADILINKYWPGPLTIIFKKSNQVPYSTTGGLDTVAVRMPNHQVALELIKASGTCIAAPSANISGRPSPTKGEHVIEDLEGRVNMIIDGGDQKIGIESTIIDLTVTPPVILRPGYITYEMIKEDIIDAKLDNHFSEEKPKAPGMKYKHYAPKADMVIVTGESKGVIEKINTLAEEKKLKGKKVGIIATTESKDLYKIGKVISVGKRNSEKEIAKNIYTALREFDRIGVDFIYCESFSDENIGNAIMNRLKKASANNIIKI